MQVSGLSWDTFWKGETEIRGTAADGEETYRVRILYKGSRVFDYSCSRMGKTASRPASVPSPARREKMGSPCAHTGRQFLRRT